MAFLAPLFLLGALAIGAPILFHLIRRHTKDVVPFSSLMFLRPSPPRVHRRSRLENLWLLLLRCLALVLLALCFARPFLKRQDAIGAGAQPSKFSVVLVDLSASMQRPDLWPAARERVLAAAAGMQMADQMALVAFDRTVRPVVTFAEWTRTPHPERRPLVEQRLAALKPGQASTALGSAILHAAELLEEVPPAPGLQREIVVISDLQEGSNLDGLQGRTWPGDLKVRLEAVGAPDQVNAAVAWIAGNADVEPGIAEQKLVLRVSNSGGSSREQFKLQRADGNGVVAGTADAYVPAGQMRTLRLPPLDQKEQAGQTVTLTGDEVGFDNQLHVLPRRVPRVPVLFVGSEDAEVPTQSLFYLQRALATMRRSEVDLQIRAGDAAPQAAELLKAQLLVLGDGITQPAAEAARHFAESGRIVLLPLTSAASGNVLPHLLGTAVSVEEAEVKNYAMLAQIEFSHPFFAVFADPRFSDFTKIHIWKHRRLDLTGVPSARVLAQFDSGDPALIQVPMGKGSVVILATSWRPAESQLALSTKFVPLLNAILEQSSQLPESRMQYFIGDEVQVSSQPGIVAVTKPDGSMVQVTDGRFTGTDIPGVYLVEPGQVRFAVNLAPDESRLAPLTHDRFTSLGVPLAANFVATGAATEFDPNAQAVELESRQKLWRWLLAAAFVILLLETWLAGRLARPAPAKA